MWKVVLTLLSVTMAVSTVRAQGQDNIQWAERLFVGYEEKGPKVLTKRFRHRSPWRSATGIVQDA